jgi:hypothetical protein
MTLTRLAALNQIKSCVFIHPPFGYIFTFPPGIVRSGMIPKGQKDRSEQHVLEFHDPQDNVRALGVIHALRMRPSDPWTISSVIIENGALAVKDLYFPMD